jgi:lysylphosphatidylglycerol synthetase-like protein (DUF2156 family)
VLILGIGVLLIRPTPLTLSGFATFLVVFAGVEAVARGRTRLLVTVLTAAAVWAVVAASVALALLRNWQVALAVLLAVTGLVLIALNLQELVGRPQARWQRRRRGDGRRGLRPMTAVLAEVTPYLLDRPVAARRHRGDPAAAHPRPRAAAGAFLAGWAVGIAAAAGVFVALATVIELSDEPQHLGLVGEVRAGRRV